jgi:hypothetical protein
MTQDIPPDTENRARALFGDLVGRRWEKAHRAFDVSMRGRVDADRIARGWTHVADPAGHFEGMGSLVHPPVRRSHGSSCPADLRGR